jgi:hypothetical protein
VSESPSSDGAELEIAPVPPDEVLRAIAAALATPRAEDEGESAWWRSGSAGSA